MASSMYGHLLNSLLNELRKRFKKTDRPMLDDLFRHVTPRCALRWKDIGRHLNITSTLLETIHYNNDGDINKCCNALWKKWLDVDPEATWEKLFTTFEMLPPGKQLPEYEVMVQYYSKLIRCLWNILPQLYGCISRCVSFIPHSWMIPYFKGFRRYGMYFMESKKLTEHECSSDTELLLAFLVMLLHNHHNHPFYIMLEFMQHPERDDDIQRLAAEMQLKIKGFDPVMSCGSQPKELHVLMDFYTRLVTQMSSIDSKKLSVRFSNAEIITLNDEKFLDWCHNSKPIGKCIPQMLLTRMAYHLLNGRIYLFYKMLEVLQSSEFMVIHRLLAEIQRVLDQTFLAGKVPTEYEVFMQHYSILANSVRGYTDELCMGFCNAQIITDIEEMNVINTRRSNRAEVLLANLAKKLSTGNTSLFYNVLKVMQIHKRILNIEFLTSTMQAKFEALDQKKSTDKQPVIEETQSGIQETTQQSDLGYKLFMQYHSKLIDMPSLLDLTLYFVAVNIITSSDGQAVINTMIIESQTAALRKLLNKISLALLLRHDGNTSLDKMLKIMQMCGDDIVQKVAAEMLKAAFKQQFSIPVTSSTEMYLLCKAMPLISSATFDHHGGKLIIEAHDVTITVPELAISEGDKVKVRAIVSLTGPYQLPDGYDLVSVFVWIEADYRFRKLVKITIPHFENLDQSFDVVVLTANEKDLVLNENGDSLLQLHESVYDYQYEVNDDYCDYYTDHFCSKCLAKRRSFFSRLFNRSALPSPGVVAPYPRSTRITVFFCVPDDYASADELLIELCICYSLKHCLQTVRKSYERRKMLSKKSNNVPWTIAIDNQKCQNFCLSCGECPGWKIEPIGLQKIKVSDLDFHTYSNLEDLRAEEELCMYPPRFKISVVRLAHGKRLDTEFNIILENNGILVYHEVRKFPLTVAKLDIRDYINQAFITTHVDSLASNTATTTTTGGTIGITTNATYYSSSTTDISLASDDLPSTTIAAVASTASITDTALVTSTHQTTLAHLPVSPTTPGNTFVKQNVIVQGGINIYQSKQLHLDVEQSRNSFNSLECFAADITGRIDMTTILPYLVSYGLLTPEQQDYLTHSGYTSSDKKQKLCNILLRLDENDVKKFLLCLSETSDYDPHKQLLEKIHCKMKETTNDDDDDDDDDAPI